VTVVRENLTFECRAEKIAIAPDQSTSAHRAEIVERNAKLGRQDVQASQSEARAMVRYIANTTCVDKVLASEEHQHVAIDRRAADGAALEVASGLEYLPKRRHAGGFCFTLPAQPDPALKVAVRAQRWSP
jgi:hypothetical protein